jgi:hypothetical protein
LTVINFVQGRSRKTTQVGVDKPWLHVTKELFPLNIAYGNFTFEKETLAITSELAASNGKFTGYIKPLFDDIAVIDLSETKPTLCR